MGDPGGAGIGVRNKAAVQAIITLAAVPDALLSTSPPLHPPTLVSPGLAVNRTLATSSVSALRPACWQR